VVCCVIRNIITFIYTLICFILYILNRFCQVFTWEIFEVCCSLLQPVAKLDELNLPFTFPFFVKQTFLLGFLCNVLDIVYRNILLSWKRLLSLLKFCASNINLLFYYKLLIGPQLTFSYLRESDTRSKHFLFYDHFINSHNLFF